MRKCGEVVENTFFVLFLRTQSKKHVKIFSLEIHKRCKPVVEVQLFAHATCPILFDLIHSLTKNSQISFTKYFGPLKLFPILFA